MNTNNTKLAQLRCQIIDWSIMMFPFIRPEAIGRTIFGHAGNQCSVLEVMYPKDWTHEDSMALFSELTQTLKKTFPTQWQRQVDHHVGNRILESSSQVLLTPKPSDLKKAN